MARRTIQEFACNLILANPEMSTESILEQVRHEFPGCSTGPNSIAWYRSGLKTGRLGASTEAAPFRADRPAAARPRHLAEPDPGWPDFGEIDEDDQRTVARLAARYVCFLHPDVVRSLVEANRLNAAAWSERLRRRNIDPALYLWDGSACAFPGVRRYAGSEEIAVYRKQRDPSAQAADAIRLDDNSFPKQIWSYVFRGRKFANFGPLNYSLAHVFDHKTYKNRADREFDNNAGASGQIPGLYTSAPGTVYIPTGLMRPTDFSFPLRNLIQRRAQYLYGEFCNLLPSPLAIRTDVPAGWSLDAFCWRDPVGTAERMPAFLRYREETMDALMSSGEDTFLHPTR